MDELKKWLLNRIAVAHGKVAVGENWEERSYAYEAVLEKIEQIESDDEFDIWYSSSYFSTQPPHRELCLRAWKAGLSHANKQAKSRPAQD